MKLVSSTLRLTTAGALGLTLAACGGGATSQTPPAAAPESDIPHYTVETPEEWAGLVDAGKASFDAACEACHPGGGADLGPTLIDIGWSTGAMHSQIREGSGRMKPISEARLPEEEMKGLLVYLASLGAVRDIAQP